MQLQALGSWAQLSILASIHFESINKTPKQNNKKQLNIHEQDTKYLKHKYTYDGTGPVIIEGCWYSRLNIIEFIMFMSRQVQIYSLLPLFVWYSKLIYSVWKKGEKNPTAGAKANCSTSYSLLMSEPQTADPHSATEQESHLIAAQ